jgi:hypothetical protein
MKPEDGVAVARRLSNAATRAWSSGYENGLLPLSFTRTELLASLFEPIQVQVTV